MLNGVAGYTITCKRKMTDNRTYVVLGNGNHELESLRENIKYARQEHWKLRQWFARPALVDKSGGSSRLYIGQSFDSHYMDLVDNAWTHDHCEVCETDISEGMEAFYSDKSWLCKSCYEWFIIPIDIENSISKLKLHK